MTSDTGARRRALRTLAAIAAAAPAAPLLVAAPARAQLPNRPLRIIVPFPAGGTADVLPRLVGEKIRDQYPAGVVVENRTGAGGNIGAEQVFRAEPDGLTVLASPPGPIAINHNLYRSLPFDPTRWVSVTVLATVPNVLAVNPQLPVKDVAGFVAHLKAHPGKVTYASQGNGTTSHLTACLFMQVTGTDMTHVPYKGTAPALVDLIGGSVDVFFDNISSSAPHHKEGKLRILAVADAERSKILPQVPTFAESRISEMNAVTFFSVVAPPGTPRAAVQALHQSMAKAMAMPDVAAKFAEQGATPGGWPPERTADFIRGETERWKKVIAAARVTLE